MKVAKYYNNRDVRLEEMPKPQIGSRELLVKVLASGICGSDVLEWYRLKKAPNVLGHEITGEIVEVGNEVTKYKTGQRVFVSHHIPCNTCHYCLSGHHTACETLHTTNYYPGGFAQYIKVPELNVDRGVFILPDEMSYEDGTFIEPLACVVRGQRIAKMQPGQAILVLGSGISGLLHIGLAKATGAGKIFATDINEFRLKSALEFGADFALNAKGDIPSILRKHNNGLLADLVIVCTGALPAFKQAMLSVERGGTVLCFATTEPGTDLPLPLNDFWRNEITIVPSYACTPADISIAIELIRSKKIPGNKMITHRLKLSEAGTGFKLVAEAKESIKVIIEPQEVKG